MEKIWEDSVQALEDLVEKVAQDIAKRNNYDIKDARRTAQILAALALHRHKERLNK